MLLPREGLTVSEYVASLTGEGLRQMLLSPVSGYVDAAVPKYKSEYGISLEEALQEMGMQNAFDELRADASGETFVTISRILPSVRSSTHWFMSPATEASKGT